MKVTKEQIIAIMPGAAKVSNLSLYVTYINGYADSFGLTTPLRMAHFLAQVAHETFELTRVKEVGNAEYCKKYEVGKLAKMLGNTQEGDGYRYKGRGFLHLTGRANYQAYTDSKYCRGDVVANPSLLEQPLGAVKSGMWYWLTRKISPQADKNDVMAVTKLINGGYNGLESRKKYLARARKALGC